MAPLVTAIREPQRGGSQAFVSDLALGLTGRGHEVHVYAASGSEIPGVEVIDTGVDPRFLAGTLYRAGPAAGEPAAAASAAAEAAFTTAYTAIGMIRYDVIHNHAFGGRVEGVIVDHVVPDHPDGRVRGGESGLGRRRRCRRRFARGWSGPVQRARQKPGIDSGVDHLDPRDLRSGGGVDVYLVPPPRQAEGQIGHECLRATALRLADGRHQRRHDGDLHWAGFIGPSP